MDTKLTLEQIITNKRVYFWDKGPMNLKQDRYIIIERILEFGTEDEIKIISDYYGREPVEEVVIQSRSLSPKTVNYFALLFGIPREKTKCFSDVSPKIWLPY
ncbi:hypothetical protein QUF90_13100 [Desulfococcaceae bacterium HSG9]|nr:hypothetical protein [Desulfococcaceae bacterium HSG9]